MNGAEMLCGVESDCLMTWGNGILMRGVRGSKYEVEEADSCLYSLTDFSWPQGYVSCDFPRIYEQMSVHSRQGTLMSKEIICPSAAW